MSSHRDQPIQLLVLCCPPSHARATNLPRRVGCVFEFPAALPAGARQRGTSVRAGGGRRRSFGQAGRRELQEARGEVCRHAHHQGAGSRDLRGSEGQWQGDLHLPHRQRRGAIRSQGGLGIRCADIPVAEMYAARRRSHAGVTEHLGDHQQTVHDCEGDQGRCSGLWPVSFTLGLQASPMDRRRFPCGNGCAAPGSGTDRQGRDSCGVRLEHGVDPVRRP